MATSWKTVNLVFRLKPQVLYTWLPTLENHPKRASLVQIFHGIGNEWEWEWEWEERREKREERRDEGERIVLPTLGMQFKGEWEERGFCARQESSAVWPFDYLTETTCQYIWSSCFVLGRNPQHLSVQSHTAMEAFHFEKATIYLWQSRGPYSVGAHPAIPWNCQLLLPHLTGVATVGWGTDAYHTPHDPRYN